MKLLIALLSIAAYAQTGPAQAVSGPGGSNYAYQSITAGPFWASGHSGDDAYRYYIYSPTCPSPSTAPVIVFFHGLDAMDPLVYVRWIEHMAKKGYTVIWLQFQTDTTPLASFKSIAVTTLADALARVDSGAPYVPPLKVSTVIQTAYVGHSVGAALAVSVAALAVSGGTIPVPIGYFGSNPGFDTAAPSLSGIPSTFKVVILVGNNDGLVCKGGASLLWAGLSAVTSKTFLVAYSDSHGSTGNTLTANHIFPTTTVVNAYDYYADWKLGTGAADCSIRGTWCNSATAAGSTEQLFMGYWSDGVAVAALGYFATPADVTLACE